MHERAGRASAAVAGVTEGLTIVSTFTKRPRERHSALAEAAGLRWLGEHSTAVVEVIAVDDWQITTRRVEEVPPTASAARQAGRDLAAMHAQGAPAFGAPPAGWDGPNYIGTQQQACEPTAQWGEFYVTQRVLPFARRAPLPQRVLALVERACAAIRAADETELWRVPPARIHGDLWAGNLLFGAEGAVVIDPAAHGGHPLTDLAMLHLFGAPYLPEIEAGYREAAEKLQLVAGNAAALDQVFIPVHQLHPLAVHALTHGPGYYGALADAARATLEILR